MRPRDLPPPMPGERFTRYIERVTAIRRPGVKDPARRPEPKTRRKR